jgi:muconolactone delta-isomerase
MVNTVLGPVENIQDYLPNEFAVVGKWKEEGILEHIFIKEAATGAVLVFQGTDQEKVRQLMSNLPLFKHFQQIDYTVLDKQF